MLNTFREAKKWVIKLAGRYNKQGNWQSFEKKFRMYRGVTAGEKVKGRRFKDFSRNQQWNNTAVKQRHAFQIVSSLRSKSHLNHVLGKEIHQTQISSSPQGTLLGISVRSDLRVLTLEDRDGDLTTFTRISFKRCLTPPTELAAQGTMYYRRVDFILHF